MDTLFLDAAMEMYSNIADQMATFEHHAHILNLIQTNGYSDALLTVAGGDKFLRSIHVGEHEWAGKNRLAKQDICMANLFTWIGSTFVAMCKKVWEFIKKICGTIITWIHGVRDNMTNQKTSQLSNINQFPKGMQVPNVYDYTALITKFTELRTAIEYLRSCMEEVNKTVEKITYALGQSNGSAIHNIMLTSAFGPAYPEKLDDANDYRNDLIKNHATSMNDNVLRYVIDTFAKELRARKCEGSVVPSPNGCRILLLTAAEEPVDPTEFGWNGGSQIKFFDTLVKTTSKDAEALHKEMTKLQDSVKDIQDKCKSAGFNENAKLIAPLVNVAVFYTSATAAIMVGVEKYHTTFSSMVTFILEQVKKK